MDRTTYPGSETDNNEVYDHCDFQSTASNDFVDQWVNLTVDKEILRGAQLREEKLKAYPQQLECEVVNIDFNAPCPEDTYYRTPSPGRSKGKTLPCSPRPKSPFLEQYHGSRCGTQPMFTRSNTPSIKMKGVPRCSMRIAELAVPTKRQCFDTWRNKCDVLPPLMVERLRQQICDEKPIVPISDALVCFKKRKPKSVKSFNKRTKTLSRDTKRKNERIAEIRQLCAAFANKIANKLITPQNLNLNPELEKLSKVVANEITKIIQNRKKYNLDQKAQRRIHADVSDKIAVWIATILEDSSYKLLEEDLRELEEEEGPVLEFIDGLVDNVLTICEPEIIDIDKEDVSDTTSKAGSEGHDEKSNVTPETTENNEFDTSTLYTNITYETGEGTINKSNEIGPLDSKTQISVIQEIDDQTFDQSEDSEGINFIINNHVQEEIDKIIDSIVGKNVNLVDEVESDIKHDPGETEHIDDLSELARETTPIPQSPGNSALPPTNKVNNVLDLPLEDDVKDSNLVNENEEDDILNELIESEGALSGELEEESLDEKNKKVKFSKIDLDIRGSPEGYNINSTKKGDEKDKLYRNTSTDSFKQDLIFAPPNENLLSDADESWPEDIATPVLKPSASVSRSVTSLGKILEKDEKLTLSDTEVLSIVDWDGTGTSELNTVDRIGKKYEDINENKEIAETKELDDDVKKTRKEGTLIPTSSQENQGSSDIETESDKNIVNVEVTNMIQDDTTGIDSGIASTQAPKLEILGSSQNSQKITDTNAETNFYDTEQSQALQPQIVQHDIKTHDSEENFLYEAIKEKMKKSYELSEPKFDYKVHPNTAPSWLKNDNGKGEPSEDSFRDERRAKAKFQDSEIRTWCKDLDRMFQNLEMWSAWIDTTCKNVIQLKQKKEMNKLFAPHLKRKDAKEWMTLKKNIDKDAILWTKLNQRAYARLKIYKDKAKIVSTEYCTMCDYKNNARKKI